MTERAGHPSEDREQIVRSEVLAPEPTEALAGVLDIDVPKGGLPALWHWIYLLERRPHKDLGPDGHPTSGIPAPPGPGRRRMFAGGRVSTYGSLELRAPATRTTWVADTREKVGRSGPLTFVTVRHEIEQGGRLAVVDEQDIVYRTPDSSRMPTAGDGSGATARTLREPSLSLDVDSALLFRFSALTYNAHRIHYDHEYVKEEGYADLVVHGPLQALLMGELIRRTGVDLVGRQYAYRLVAPMTGPQRITVVASPEGIEAGAETRDQHGIVTAVSTLQPVPEYPGRAH